MENTPEDIQIKTIELLDILLYKQLITADIHSLIKPSLEITTYKFNTMRIYTELLSILAMDIKLSYHDYLSLNKYYITQIVKIDIDKIVLPNKSTLGGIH